MLCAYTILCAYTKDRALCLGGNLSVFKMIFQLCAYGIYTMLCVVFDTGGIKTTGQGIRQGTGEMPETSGWASLAGLKEPRTGQGPYE